MWTRVAVGLVVVGGGLGVARDADACSFIDPCNGSDRFLSFELAHDVVAIDGVLAFHFERLHVVIDDAGALAYVDVVVTDADGSVVPGTVVPSGADGIAIFRPSAPWAVSSSYTVEVSVDNDALAADHERDPSTADCAGNLSGAHALQSTADVLPELVAPVLTPITALEVWPSLSSLDHLVCCDGAYPTQDPFSCTDAPATWTEGHCAGSRGDVLVRGGFELDSGFAPELAADLVPRLVIDDSWTVQAEPHATEVSVADARPFCARVELWSLSRGTIASTRESCFGDAVADQLGRERAIDPSEDLAGACNGTPYTCSVSDDVTAPSWDPRACDDWPTAVDDSGGSDEDGGTDDSGATSDAGSADAESSGESDSGAAADALVDGGCACSATRSAPPIAPLVVMLLAIARPRARTPRSRRQASRSC